MEIPARDFSERIGAGDDVGAVVIAERGFPAERFGEPQPPPREGPDFSRGQK